MESFTGRTAFITGAASGIGQGIAEALSAAGARIVVADIDSDAAQAAADRLNLSGGEAMAVHLDVASPAAWAAARTAATERFGKVHVLCNNAGVTGSMRTRLAELSQDGWTWTRSIILDGTVNGVTAFLPHMLAHGEPGHVVNTGSMASLMAAPGTGDYTVAKFGVAGLTEVLRLELEGSNLSASILCPGFTRTALIANSRTHMPAQAAAEVDKMLGGRVNTPAMESGLDPRVVGEMVRRGIQQNRLYIFSHPEFVEPAKARFDGILDDFAWAETARQSIGGGGVGPLDG